jgi:hypothetical protein
MAIYRGWRYIECGDKSKYRITGISVHRLFIGGKWGCCCIGTVARRYVEGWLYDVIRLHSPVSKWDGMMGCWESGKEPLGAPKELGDILALCTACKNIYSTELFTLGCEVYSYYTLIFQTKSGEPPFVWWFLKHMLPRLIETSALRSDTWNKHTVCGSDIVLFIVDGISIIAQLISKKWFLYILKLTNCRNTSLVAFRLPLKK